MSIKRIKDLPDGSGNLTGDDIFFFMDDPSGVGISKKVTLNQLASILNTNISISGSGGVSGNGLTLEQVDDRVSQLLVAGTGVSLNYNDENNSLTISFNASGVGSGNCCNPFDQDLNTYNFPTFSGVNLSNNTSLAQGTYDNGTGGNNGISLNCAVGYELNWQGGRLKNTYNNGETASPIYIDSNIEFPGTGLTYMKVDSSGITFSDDTRQITAYTGCPCIEGSGNGLSPYTTGVGLYSIQPIEGNNVASGNYSNVTGGKDAKASLYGEEAHAAGKFFSAGDAQVRKFVLRTSTNGITQTIDGVNYYPLSLDGGDSNTLDYRITIPNDASWCYTIKVISRQDNTGYSAAYEFKGVLKVYELYGAALMPYMETVLYEDVPDWHVYIRTINNTLDICARVPDTTAGIVYWVAYVEAVQVIAPPPPDEPPLPPSSSSSESSSSEGTSSSSSEGGSSSSAPEESSSSSSAPEESSSSSG